MFITKHLLALVAAGGGANREGDEREEVLRNKHGGGAALRRTGAALSEVECRFSRESESSKCYTIELLGPKQNVLSSVERSLARPWHAVHGSIGG